MQRLPLQQFVRKALLFFAILAFVGGEAQLTAAGEELPTTPKAESLMAQTKQKIRQELESRGFAFGKPIFIRIFKLPGILELWMEKGRNFELFKTYRICNYSGYPGPKLSEGDWQAPEGFYTVSAHQMNPKSAYHLAFDIGYPNELDEARHRTGDQIMVHGNCKSVGCFAMTDDRIEEIYLLAHEALKSGQERFAVHIFPFSLTPLNLKKFAASPWSGFWQNLEPGYTAFEQSHQVPEVAVQNGEYVVTAHANKVAMNQPLNHGR